MTRAAVGALLSAIAGLALGYQLWGGAQSVVETAAPEVRQPDGSLVLERAPDPAAKPAHQVPRGTTLERTVTVTVQPSPSSTLPLNPGKIGSGKVVGPSSPDVSRAPDLPCSCAPVHVDLSLVRQPNGMRRVVASARGGTILGGVDIPVESAAPARVLRWAVGATYDNRGAWGGFIDRDLERLSFVRLPSTVGLGYTPGPEGGYGQVRFGIRF